MTADEFFDECIRTGFSYIDPDNQLHTGMELNGQIENADSPDEVKKGIAEGYPYDNDACFLVSRDYLRPVSVRDSGELRQLIGG